MRLVLSRSQTELVGVLGFVTQEIRFCRAVPSLLGPPSVLYQTAGLAKPRHRPTNCGSFGRSIPEHLQGPFGNEEQNEQSSARRPEPLRDAGSYLMLAATEGTVHAVTVDDGPGAACIALAAAS